MPELLRYQDIWSGSIDRCKCRSSRGPVQLTFARSIDPIVALEHSITRLAVTTETEAAEQGGDNRTMGRKFTVPYGYIVLMGLYLPPCKSDRFHRRRFRVVVGKPHQYV